MSRTYPAAWFFPPWRTFPRGASHGTKGAERLALAAGEVVCLAAPEPFQAVSLFFDDFSQVSDREVIEILAADHERIPLPSPS